MALDGAGWHPAPGARLTHGPRSVLQDTTGAGELLVTAITDSHADRIRFFELLAREWGQA